MRLLCQVAAGWTDTSILCRAGPGGQRGGTHWSREIILGCCGPSERIRCGVDRGNEGPTPTHTQ
jgi:hypothetical protein